MLQNTLINKIATKTIAKALGELNERLIYVGGAVVSLYIDDLSAALSYKIKFKHIYSRVDIRMPKFNDWGRALTKELLSN